MDSVAYLNKPLGLGVPHIGSGSTGKIAFARPLRPGEGVAGLIEQGDYQPAGDAILGVAGALLRHGTLSPDPPEFFYTTTFTDLGSSALGIVLGGTLILGNWASEGPETTYTLRMTSPAPNAQVTYQTFHAATALVKSAVGKESLKPLIGSFLREGEYEDLEIGVASALSREVLALVTARGVTAIDALRDILEVGLPSDEVMSILLRQLGRVRHKDSHRSRRELLIDLLRSGSVRVRHAAATGLAELDDPAAVPAVESALDREPYERPREHLQLVLEQLRDTQRCLSTS